MVNPATPYPGPWITEKDNYKLKSVTVNEDEYIVTDGGFGVVNPNKILMKTKKPASERQAGGKHYKDMVIQPKYFCQVNRLNAMETDVIKYVCRHNKKTGKEGGALDIKKAIHMLEFLLEVEYNEEVLK